MILPGSVVSIPIRLYALLPIVHVGLATDERGSDGRQTIIHASRRYGVVVESLWNDFLWGALGEAELEGYPGTLPPAEVLARARERLGVPYDLRRYNCEHFVCDAHGLLPRSPQWEAWARRAIVRDGDPWGRA